MAKQIIIPSNPKDIERIGRLVQDACDCLTRIEAEREAIKDIVALIKEDFELPPKYSNKLIKTKYKGDFDKLEAEQEDFAELYAKVVK